MTTRLFLFSISMLLFGGGCGEHHEKVKYNNHDSLKVAHPKLLPKNFPYHIVIASKDSSVVFTWDDSYSGEEDMHPVNVKAKKWTEGSLVLPFDFSSDSVLWKLFGGRLYKTITGNESHTVACWRCSAMKRKIFGAASCEDDSLVFPDSLGNATDAILSYSWTQPNGKSYLLFGFNTSVFSKQMDPGVYSHFMSGAVGIALFERKNQGWYLLNFSPAIANSGVWGRADAPEVAVTGYSSFLVLVPDHCQGGGSPVWNTVKWFAFDGKEFKQVSDRMDWGIDANGRITDWTSVIVPDSNERGMLPQVLLKSYGELYADDTVINGANNNIPESAEWYGKKEAFKFQRTQQLNFTNDRYKVISTTFTADTTWTPDR